MLELPFELQEGRILKLKNIGHSLVFVASLDDLCDNMRVVDRTAAALLYLFQLVLVENVVQVRLLNRQVITSELNRWESELRLLHVVVNLLVEILAHVRLKDHWKMISIPLPLASSVQSEYQCVQVIHR